VDFEKEKEPTKTLFQAPWNNDNNITTNKTNFTKTSLFGMRIISIDSEGLAVLKFNNSFELASLKLISNDSFDIYVEQLKNLKEVLISVNETYYKSLIKVINNEKSLHRHDLISWEATEFENVTNGLEVKI